ncbi:hypothetical protein A6A06_16525 [Streptomyces sp. CB02923]|nr:hypothetical protein A6A06_16525 [Streptomyces sp. CB02923]
MTGSPSRSVLAFISQGAAFGKERPPAAGGVQPAGAHHAHPDDAQAAAWWALQARFRRVAKAWERTRCIQVRTHGLAVVNGLSAVETDLAYTAFTYAPVTPSPASRTAPRAAGRMRRASGTFCVAPEVHGSWMSSGVSRSRSFRPARRRSS